jgi:hypothetical protein
MFFMLRDEIRTNKIMDVADKKVIEFRLDALENKKHLAIKTISKFATVPTTIVIPKPKVKYI